MNILNRLIEDLLSRSEVRIGEATFTIGLEPNTVMIQGSIPVKVVDTEKANAVKVLANLTVPVKAKIAIDLEPFPIPTFQ